MLTRHAAERCRSLRSNGIVSTPGQERMGLFFWRGRLANPRPPSVRSAAGSRCRGAIRGPEVGERTPYSRDIIFPPFLQGQGVRMQPAAPSIYVVQGAKMIGGFRADAWPARIRNSGRHDFCQFMAATVYQKDSGNADRVHRAAHDGRFDSRDQDWK